MLILTASLTYTVYNKEMTKFFCTKRHKNSLSVELSCGLWHKYRTHVTEMYIDIKVSNADPHKAVGKNQQEFCSSLSICILPILTGML